MNPTACKSSGFRVAALALALAALAPTAAYAQATISVEGGLDGHYRSDQWVPLRVQLTNQGAPARVEVRAKFQQGAQESDEYRLPTRDLMSGANQSHTLYVKAPASYASQAVQVELFRDGRSNNRVRVPLNLVADGDWLVLGIGNSDSTLKLLTTLQLNAQQASPSARPWNQRGNQIRVQVATQSPAEVTDRWQGLTAADMIVLGDVSERDLSPEQQSALRDYVAAGGSLVITGGVNWNRLTTPFFADMLPVRVTGGRTASEASGLRSLVRRPGPTGSQFGLCAAAPKPGSHVLAGSAAVPLVVVGPKGAGRVLFTAFDPSLPPFRTWEGGTDLWKALLTQPRPPALVPTLNSSEQSEPDYYGGNFGGSGRGGLALAEAPYAISQLDIPAFYVVALFLLAYIIVLVPVNYFFLKARDKKEYAWLTTPAIVAIFSIGAYMIGYGFKGGRTLLVRVGVVEARAGQDSAPTISYAGLFSPRKTGYEIQLAPGDPTNGESASALLSEPRTDRATPGMLVLEDETQQIREFAVDMWAMRVLKSESVVRLGQGFSVTLNGGSKALSGTVRNGTSLALTDCRIVTQSQIFPAGDLAAGGTLTIQATGGRSATGGGVLPAGLLDEVEGKSEDDRVKRALLAPLCSGNVSVPGWRSPDDPLLVGWLKAPLSQFQVNGRPPREQSATLFILHLGKPGGGSANNQKGQLPKTQMANALPQRGR